jgi:hypothetical protein
LALFAIFGLVLAPRRASAEQAAVTGIVASGSGEVRVRPDSMRVTIGVEAQGKTVEEVERLANEKMTRVLASLRALQIPNLQLKTSILTVRPVHATTPEGMIRTAEIVGYSAVNAVSVVVRQAPREQIARDASAIMSATLRSGANLTGDFEFFLDDPSRAQAEALAKAVADARRHGESMAAAAGVAITGVALVSEGGSIAPVLMQGMGYGAPSAAPPMTPVEAGEIVVSSTVTMRLTIR